MRDEKGDKGTTANRRAGEVEQVGPRPGGTVAGRAATVSSPFGEQTSNKPDSPVVGDASAGSPGAEEDRARAEKN